MMEESVRSACFDNGFSLNIKGTSELHTVFDIADLSVKIIIVFIYFIKKIG